MKKIYTVIGLFIQTTVFSQIVLVKDINEGASGSNLNTFYEFNGTLFFRADNGSVGQEIWKSDGTPEGTILVKDINVGAGSCGFPSFINSNSELYFNAVNIDNGDELWKTDGTESGTILVKDIRVGNQSSSPIRFTSLDSGTFLFGAEDGTEGVELWKSDGTAAGTTVITVYEGEGTSESIGTNITMNDIAYQIHSLGDVGSELYKSDGTLSGTSLVKDINPGSESSMGFELFKTSNNIIYFKANNGTSGYELWKSDGTEAGTVLVKDIIAGAEPSFDFDGPRNFVELNNIVYFIANDGVTGSELWKTDGTEAGTTLLFDINPGIDGSIRGNPTVLENNLYFWANDGSSSFDFYKYDGVDTLKLKDFNTNVVLSANLNYAAIDGIVYFSAFDNLSVGKLYMTDGTPEGTVSVASNFIGSLDPNIYNIIKVDNKILFSGREIDEDDLGPELYMFDPSTIVDSVVIGADNVNESISSVSTYPNPVNNQLTLNFNLKNNNKVSLEVYDILGNKVLAENFGQLNAGQNKKEIQLNGLAAGLYNINLLVNRTILTQKVQVNK